MYCSNRHKSITFRNISKHEPKIYSNNIRVNIITYRVHMKLFLSYPNEMNERLQYKEKKDRFHLLERVSIHWLQLVLEPRVERFPRKLFDFSEKLRSGLATVGDTGGRCMVWWCWVVWWCGGVVVCWWKVVVWW